MGFTIEDEKIVDLGGIGDSKIPAIICMSTIILGDEKINCRVAWALVDDVPPLLGRVDIFDKFKITFEEQERKITFEKIKR